MLKNFSINAEKRKKILGLFPNKDKVIERCLDEGMNLDKIMEVYQREDLFDAEKIRKDADEFWLRLEKREAEWDIKISDYMKLIYRQHALFENPSHLSSIVCGKIGVRILKYMGIEDNVDFQFEFADAYPMMNCVKKALGLNIEQKSIRVKRCTDYDRLIDEPLSLREYLSEYIYWVKEYDKELLKDRLFKRFNDGMGYVFIKNYRYLKPIFYWGVFLKN